MAARVSSGSATESIPLSVVASVAAHDKIPPAEAVKRLVDDAVAAVVAREKGVDREAPARWRLVSARARIAADRIRAEAKAGGPPTDDEVKELTLKYWREVDRPASVRTEHVVVLNAKHTKGKPQPNHDDRAKALAAKLHDALVPVKSEDFVEKAQAFEKDADLDVVAEPIPPVTTEGFSLDAPGKWDLDYVKAAFALKEVGDTSAVIESAFGWHVIRLLEKLPEQRMTFEDRRVAFTKEVITLRGKKAVEARLAPLRAANPVAIVPSAEQLMRSVTTPEAAPHSEPSGEEP